jgi:hypothetical protein
MAKEQLCFSIADCGGRTAQPTIVIPNMVVTVFPFPVGKIDMDFLDH